MATDPLPSPGPPHLGEPADLFDYRQLADYYGFVRGSLRRHPRLFAGTLAGTIAFSALALFMLPKSYHVESMILTQRNQLMPALGNPRRAVPWDADSPTRAATETVLRRDNLVSLIKQTGLLDKWDQTRAPILRLKDGLFRLVLGKPTEEDRVDALLGVLEKRLFVKTEEGTVTIGIDWPNAQLAYHLVESAQQNFLETRHAAEISTIAEAISILEGHANEVHESIQTSLDELQRFAAGKGRPPGPLPSPARAGEVSRRTTADPDLAQVKVLLAAKRRAIADLDDFRQRRLAELKADLAEQQKTYGPLHPVIANTEQSIEALSQESPQIATLRKEEQELVAELGRRGGREETSDGEVARRPPLPTKEAQAAAKPSGPVDEDDPMLDYSRSRLRIAISKYEDFLERIDGARIELDTARAAFKYRYTVIRPAQVPKKPQKPNPVLFLLGGGFAGLCLALVLAVLADVRSGRVLESWQVVRWVGLPVLAEVRRP